jgi:integrase
MSITDRCVDTSEDLLAAYTVHCVDLGLTASAQHDRLRDAQRFFDRHGDLSTWMERPLSDRLVDLGRIPLSWPLITFASLTGRVVADMDLLAAKNAGRRFATSAAVIYPDEIRSLRAAAGRLEWAEPWTKTVLGEALPLAAAFTGRSPATFTPVDIDTVRAAIRATPHYTAAVRRSKLSHLHSLARLLYEAHFIDIPPVHRRQEGPGNLASRLQVVASPEIRLAMLSYLEARQAVVKPRTIRNRAGDLACFGEFLSDRYPDLTSLASLERAHIEAYCAWLPTRRWRGQRACERQVGTATIIAALTALRCFLDDISAWGWAQAPSRRIMFSSDVPRPPRQLPRALAPNVDTALMAAVAHLSDRFARVALTVLRGTGLRIGELLDLEVDCVVDYGTSGIWLRVPLGKLDSERSVPLDASTVAALDEWTEQRGNQRSLPHPRDGRPADFLFVERGRRPSSTRIERGLADAARNAGLTGPDGTPLHVVAHQLRHTYATALANAGMSIQGLMALLGHSTPEMTLRYATLASPTLRSAYDVAIGKVRPRIPLTPTGRRPLPPDKVEWLASEMLKTRVAHGYCARDLVAEACPYANICENCSNFVAAPEFALALQAQLADVQTLRDDAESRGWTSEQARHEHVIDSLQGHLRRLGNPG